MKNKLIVMCCVCKRVRNKNYEWVKRDVETDEISHTYCPECYESEMKNFSSRSIDHGRYNVPPKSGSIECST